MKRYIVAFFALAVIVAPATGFAQTDVAALQAQIQALLAQIKSLNEQMQALQTQKQQVVTNLLTTLKEGSQGDSVTTLQALLAADPELYPEGLITGFYGRLTSAAVKRFQKKYGIEQVGFVGPKTLKKLNEFFNDHPVAFEKSGDDDDDDKNSSSSSAGIGVSRRICAKIAPGHLIAPGWLRKNNGIQPIVPICQNLPPGIVTNPNWPGVTPTSTPDVTAPIISNISASVSANAATISWTTNENADTQVSYGTSTPYTASSSLNSTLVTSHSQVLTGLLPSTTYHYQVRSKDIAGNATVSSDQTFTTSAQGDVTAPTLTNISATVGADNVNISWTTNEAADTQISYGTSTAYGATTSLNSTLATSHSQFISGLLPLTTYHYQVMSKDGSGNLATSTDQSFTTLAQGDVSIPILSSLVVTPGSSTISLAWNTNEVASSKTYYVTGGPVDVNNSSTPSIFDATLTTSHAMVITGLPTSTTYQFVVESADAANNKGTLSGSATTLAL